MTADVDPDTHVQRMDVTSISRLAPFSALILTIAFVILFALRYFVLERFLLPKFYGPIYKDLSDLNKRGFLNHHIAGCAKPLIFICRQLNGYYGRHPVGLRPSFHRDIYL